MELERRHMFRWKEGGDFSGRVRSEQVVIATGMAPKKVQQSFKRSLIMLLACLVVMALSLASQRSLVECQEEQLTVASRQQKSDDLNDTIKYLEMLDSYLSQVGRPRYGRSDYKQRVGQRLPLEEPSRSNAPGSLAELIRSRLAQRYIGSRDF